MIDLRKGMERIGKLSIKDFIAFLKKENTPPISNAQKKIIEKMLWTKE